MLAFWGLLMGLPLAVFGGLACVREPAAWRLAVRFENSKACAVALTAVGWFWTAYECDTIGIDVFDMLLKRFPGQLWAMAAVLTVLTVLWMPKNLPVRALTGLLMLLPAELFKATRPLLPASGFAAVQLFVATAYLGAIVGMYGMFYPWRLETALRLLHERAAGLGLRLLGGAAALLGAALVLLGFTC